MVYEKYIKRGDKVYGPYSYKSVKKDGRVITEYIGKPEKKSLKKDISPKKYFIVGALGLLTIFSLLVLYSDFQLTGKVVLDIEQTYELGQPVTGTIKFLLTKGEIVPSSSEVQISLGNFSNNYILEDIIPDEKIQGNFNLKNIDLIGKGEGYGPSEEVYPNVTFELRIISYKEPTVPTPEPKQPTEEENITPEEPEEVINITEEPTNITEQPEQPTEPEEPEQPEQPTEPEEIVEQPAEEAESPEEEQEEEPEKEEEIKLSPLTGEVILTPKEETISGVVSSENPFTYTLEERQTAEIISSTQGIELDITNNTLVVTTKYKERPTKDLIIDLSTLNIPAEEGSLTVSLVYNNTQLFSATKKIVIKETTPILTNQTLFTINTEKQDYIGNETVQLSGELIINGAEITDNITIVLLFNETQIQSTQTLSQNGQFTSVFPTSFENEGVYKIEAIYNNITAQATFLYLSTNITILEGYFCKEFQDSVLWSNGYTHSKAGSLEYFPWTPTHNCSEIGSSDCLLHNITVRTRFIYADIDTSIPDSQREGYVKISEPDESVCNELAQGNYSKYLAHKTISEEEKGWEKYCKKDKNPIFGCSVEVFDKYPAGTLCYGIETYVSQYSIVDIVEIKYNLCWEK